MFPKQDDQDGGQANRQLPTLWTTELPAKLRSLNFANQPETTFCFTFGKFMP
ncbi:hypothetical protein GXM_03591 [Nostoc sphaeroides CCNUC1]|uniref:Uncharacterized protein n=1 Tax=Nostoc sphaeroides CCNUC1 TaxID=2653204 RepID=A0A5P8W0I1_9NOSO|nr:hypothetical protein GXM_03591 [Nostoc sphaeroides CCNUC1]